MKKIFSSTLIIFLVSVFSSSVYADSFKIQEIEVIEADIIEIEFTRELDTSLTAIREFILEEESSAQEIEILLSEVVPENSTKVTLMLGSFLSENTDYTITVLDIKDSNGNTVEAGIDSIFTFNTGVMSIAEAPITPEDDTLVQDTITPEDDMSFDDSLNIDLNAANETGEANVNGIAGTTTHSNGMDLSVMSHANQNDSLPETGPEIVLLLLLAIIFTGAYLYIQKPRT